MAPIQNAAVIFTKVPTSYPEVGKHIKYVKDRTIDLKTVDTQGGIVTKNLVISIDPPYMLGRMRSAGKRNHLPPFTLNIGEPKKGETIFISGASGAVSQIVGQLGKNESNIYRRILLFIFSYLAKREGLIVIGSAGSDDKVQWLKNELNFDHVFNYKTADVKAELAKFNPLNIYFDNAGGNQLEAAIDVAVLLLPDLLNVE
jgi:NADPH-dependent curcumin reductase CurA